MNFKFLILIAGFVFATQASAQTQISPWDMQINQWRNESLLLKAEQIPELEAAAQRGDVRAAYLLYSETDKPRYEYAKRPSANQIADWAKKIADAGNPIGMRMLCYLQDAGEFGAKKDPKEAFEHCQRAADLGLASAMDLLSLNYAKGTNAPKNEQLAISWLLKAVNSGSTSAMLGLGSIYLNGQMGLSKDVLKAVNLFQQAAELNDAQAMHNLGFFYASGLGVTKSEFEALKWYRKAADMGVPASMNNLALIYFNGRGTPKDADEGFRWLIKAADSGDVDSMINIGNKYGDTKSPFRNDAEAIRWLLKAATLKNNAEVFFNLGSIYQYGSESVQNKTEAFSWLKKSAFAGSSNGMLNFGIIYLKGEAVEKDLSTGYEWIKKSADLNNAVATLTLGELYAYGKGTQKNTTEAARLYVKALASKQDIGTANPNESMKQRAKRKLDELLSAGEITDPQVLREVQAISKPAPTVEWVNLPATSSDEATIVTVRLADAGGGLGRVELRLNGAVVGDLTADGAAGRNASRLDLPKADTVRGTTLRLPAGTHQLEVWAYNAENLINFSKLRATIQSTYEPPRKPRLYAVVVGVDTYEDTRLQLNFSVADAKAVGAALQKQIDSGTLYSGGAVRVLTTKAETSKASIVQALRALHSADPSNKERVQTDDVFVFYNAGHGSYDKDEHRYHLFTSDVLHRSADRLMQTTIVSEELRALISNIPAQKKLIALDTCNSGGFARDGAKGFVSDRDAMGEQQIIDSMKRRTGAVVFAASGSEELAREGYEGHGVFTYYLLQGLKGDAARPSSPFVSTDDLKIYIEEQLPAAMERKKWGKQAPSISTHQDGFPLAAR